MKTAKSRYVCIPSLPVSILKYLLCAFYITACAIHSTPAVVPITWATSEPALPLVTLQPEMTPPVRITIVALTPESTAVAMIDPVIPPVFIPDICTTVYLNLRRQPAIQQEVLRVLPSQTFIQRTGNAETRDGYTWVEVLTADGERGWVARRWLSIDACEGVMAGGNTPTIVNDAYRSGYAYGERVGSYHHYGVDIYSNSGDRSIYSPFHDRVVAADACETCLLRNAGDGNDAGQTADPATNYGYGAMTIVEYASSDLSAAQRAELQKDNIELAEGESLYLMFAHLDPNESIAMAGTKLEQGENVAVIGNSGNSYGAHAHVEAAVQESGLSWNEDTSLAFFWSHTVIVAAPGSDREQQRVGKRVDPTPLFDLHY